MFVKALVSCLLVGSASAQFPPARENVTTVKSRFHDGVKVSYKESNVCETTPGVKSYAGYVHLPPNAIDEPHEQQEYPINTFFWFFEARNNPKDAPLSIWLNGGPGGSSLMGALSENGPCFVGSDSNSTYLNPWSWNNEVNMLYIDQPVQVGFSYDTPTNITYSLSEEEPGEFGWRYKVADFQNGVPTDNSTFLTGTTGSLNQSLTANSTHHAAVAIWHFAQTWFEEFPHYKPNDEQISLFTESYGGHYGPAFVSFFMRQNELIANGTITGPGAHYLHMNTLGIVNGCVNSEDQIEAYASFPNNNTYGIKAFTDAEYRSTMHELEKPGGIRDAMRKCIELADKLDHDDYGDIDMVNKVCADANAYGSKFTAELYNRKRTHGWYDITHPAEDPFPPEYLQGFLNQHWVQKSLGVPVNFSSSSSAVSSAFSSTGDMLRKHSLRDIAYILDHGVKVAMIYGDRDYACNWVGGEQTSLKIPWGSQAEFAEAGYTPFAVSHLSAGGLVRQYGNLSFTRFYDAGHLVPSYNPEGAYKLFMRALQGKDIATGAVDVGAYAEAHGVPYSTTGPKDTWWMKSNILPAPAHECYALEPMRCTAEEVGWLMNGTAVVRDWIVIGKEPDHDQDAFEHGLSSGLVQAPLHRDLK